MLDLDDLSAIGFGTYRWTATPEQVRALHLALDAGCNLVDTAATYGDGLAEQGLGRVLAHRTTPVFVITKAGYLDDGEAAADAVVLEDGRSRYSIHPELLDRRVTRSAQRLGRTTLDAFLLHNPEHLLAGKEIDEYWQCVRRAFEFCEQAVRAGRIRYYGVSSNTLARPDHPLGPATVDTLVAVARSVASSHHFRLVQFPHNLVERHTELLRAAARAGLRTFGNRPLSVRTATGPLRLLDPPPPPGRSSAAALDELSRAIDDACTEGGVRTAAEPPVLAAIVGQWSQVRTVDAVEFVVDHVLAPAVLRVTDALRVTGLDPLLAEVRAAALAEARRAQAAAGAAVVARAGLTGEPGDPVALRACRGYLRDGLDHVLVGLRRDEHVRTVAPLLVQQ